MHSPQKIRCVESKISESDRNEIPRDILFSSTQTINFNGNLSFNSDSVEVALLASNVNGFLSEILLLSNKSAVPSHSWQYCVIFQRFCTKKLRSGQTPMKVTLGHNSVKARHLLSISVARNSIGWKESSSF